MGSIKNRFRHKTEAARLPWLCEVHLAGSSKPSICSRRGRLMGARCANCFERERIENLAKRQQRAQDQNSYSIYYSPRLFLSNRDGCRKIAGRFLEISINHAHRFSNQIFYFKYGKRRVKFAYGYF